MDQVVHSSLYLLTQYFPSLMYIVALIISTTIISTRRRHQQRRHNINTLIAYIMLFAVGFAGVWQFIFYLYVAAIRSYEYQSVLVYLALSIAGIFSFRSSHGYRVATTVIVTALFWGNAIVNLYLMFANQGADNVFYSANFYYDLIVPANLIILLLLHRKYRNNVFS